MDKAISQELSLKWVSERYPIVPAHTLLLFMFYPAGSILLIALLYPM